jgi:hypothetical protein
MTNRETAEAEAALKGAHRRLDVLERQVFDARTAAREAQPVATGWSTIVDAAFAVFRSELGRARGAGALKAAHTCIVWKAKFLELSRKNYAQRSSAGFQASQQAAPAPLPPTFDPASFVSRVATQGISLTVSPSGEILARGRLDPTTKQIMIRHKVAIVAYLQTPAQVVA